MEIIKGKIIEALSRLVSLMFVAFAVTLALYGVFFHFAPYIWSLNSKIAPDDVTPAIRPFLDERDGMETYALYVLALVDLILVAALAKLSERLKTLRSWKFFPPLILAALLIAVACFRYYVWFVPPWEVRPTFPTTPLVTILALVVLWFLMRIAGRRRRFVDAIIVVALVPVCFVMTNPMDLNDYSYVFAPALRLIDHFRFSDIYFQYDLFLSLLAAAWMKLRISLQYFPVLGQLSFFAFFLTSLFWSRRFFVNKQLSYYLLFALVLMRVYAPLFDPLSAFQLAPLRLDLWLILFVIAYEKGVYSKWLGAVLGLLVIFHRAFGLIYVLSYFELLAVLWLVDLFQSRLTWRGFGASLKKHLVLAWPNLAFVAAGLATAALMFGGLSPEAASTYRQIGIGFASIYEHSFYWYVPVMFAVALVLLLRKRVRLGARYFQAGVFLILLAVGNSLYFFGRSHELYIIYISAVLLYVFFLFLDLVFSGDDGFDQSRLGRKLAIAVPTIFVVTIAFCYSGRIYDKLKIQVRNLAVGRGVYAWSLEDMPDVLKPVTGGSRKVYFMSNRDFAYYYYWGYVPQGRYSPYSTWVFKKDALNFIQGLLENGYYVVVPEGEVSDQSEMLAGLRYGHQSLQNGYLVVWR